MEIVTLRRRWQAFLKAVEEVDKTKPGTHAGREARTRRDAAEQEMNESFLDWDQPLPPTEL